MTTEPVARIAAFGDIAGHAIETTENRYDRLALLLAGVTPQGGAAPTGGYDSILTLGDTQYDCGEPAHWLGGSGDSGFDFFDNEFGTYRNAGLIRPALGNHDAANNLATSCPDYGDSIVYGAYPTDGVDYVDASEWKGRGYFGYFNGTQAVVTDPGESDPLKLAGVNGTGNAGDTNKGHYTFGINGDDWLMVAANTQCQWPYTPQASQPTTPGEWDHTGYHNASTWPRIGCPYVGPTQTGKQYNVLRTAIEQHAGADPEGNGCQLAYFHIPLLSDGEHGRDVSAANSGDWHGTKPPSTNGGFFDASNVDIVLTGHDHNYQRFEPVSGVKYEQVDDRIDPGTPSDPADDTAGRDGKVDWVQLDEATVDVNGTRSFVVGSGGKSTDKLGAVKGPFDINDPVDRTGTPASYEVASPSGSVWDGSAPDANLVAAKFAKNTASPAGTITQLYGLLELTLKTDRYDWRYVAYVNDELTPRVLDAGSGTCH